MALHCQSGHSEEFHSKKSVMRKEEKKTLVSKNLRYFFCNGEQSVSGWRNYYQRMSSFSLSIRMMEPGSPIENRAHFFSDLLLFGGCGCAFQKCEHLFPQRLPNSR